MRMLPHIFRTLAQNQSRQIVQNQTKQMPVHIHTNPGGLQVKSVVSTQNRNYSDGPKISAFDFLNRPTRLGDMKLKSYEFEEKIVHSTFPVIVNWHAEWCEPCHALTPALKDIIMDTEFVCCATLECEENLELMYHFQVKRLPTLMAFWEGYLVKKFVGMVDIKDVEKLVTKLDKAYLKRTMITSMEEVNELVASLHEDTVEEIAHSIEEREHCKDHVKEIMEDKGYIKEALRQK